MILEKEPQNVNSTLSFPTRTIFSPNELYVVLCSYFTSLSVEVDEVIKVKIDRVPERREPGMALLMGAYKLPEPCLTVELLLMRGGTQATRREKSRCPEYWVDRRLHFIPVTEFYVRGS